MLTCRGWRWWRTRLAVATRMVRRSTNPPRGPCLDVEVGNWILDDHKICYQSRAQRQYLHSLLLEQWLTLDCYSHEGDHEGGESWTEKVVVVVGVKLFNIFSQESWRAWLIEETTPLVCLTLHFLPEELVEAAIEVGHLRKVIQSSQRLTVRHGAPKNAQVKILPQTHVKILLNAFRQCSYLFPSCSACLLEEGPMRLHRWGDNMRLWLLWRNQLPWRP